MASVPRYLGTTVEAAKAYVRDELGVDDFLRVFDRDGDGEVAAGTEDERGFVKAVCSAETEVDEALAASHGAPFTGEVPDSVKQIAALRTPWCAVRTRPWSDAEKAPFRVLYKDTDARLARLATDNRGRIPERGPAEPTASAGSVEAAPMPWTDAVSRRSWSGF